MIVYQPLSEVIIITWFKRTWSHSTLEFTRYTHSISIHRPAGALFIPKDYALFPLASGWSDDSVVCHCLAASPWVIASPDTRLLVPLTHPNAQEIKCSVEVIKKVNPGCVLCWRLRCCGGRYYHIKPRLRGSQPRTPTLHLSWWGFTAFPKTACRQL